MVSKPADPAAPAYWELIVTLEVDAAETAEGVTNRLWELGAVGVVEEATPGAAALRAFFPPGADAASLAADLRDYLGDLAALALPGALGCVGVAPLADEAWADAWRAHFRPVPVGRGLLVCPPWEVPEPALAHGRVVVLIEPGRAFGTGSHGSTKSCLQLLERALAGAAVPHALDVGCGSGILAIAALKLGAAAAVAVDVDPLALEAARYNARRNAVALELADARRALDADATITVANILANPLRMLAPIIAGHTVPGGMIALSGILEDQRSEERRVGKECRL